MFFFLCVFFFFVYVLTNLYFSHLRQGTIFLVTVMSIGLSHIAINNPHESRSSAVFTSEMVHMRVVQKVLSLIGFLSFIPGIF